MISAWVPKSTLVRGCPGPEAIGQRCLGSPDLPDSYGPDFKKMQDVLSSSNVYFKSTSMERFLEMCVFQLTLPSRLPLKPCCQAGSITGRSTCPELACPGLTTALPVPSTVLGHVTSSVLASFSVKYE